MSIEGVLTSINNLFKYLIEVICILVTRLFFQNNLFNNPHLGPIHAHYCEKKKILFLQKIFDLITQRLSLCDLQNNELNF